MTMKYINKTSGVFKSGLRKAFLCGAALLLLPFSGWTEIKVKLGGRLFMDGGVYQSAPDIYSHRVGITDLRFTGKFYWDDGWYTKLDVGFAKNKVRLKDAFLQKTTGKNMFRVGYMIGLFGLDDSASTNDYIFLTGANIAETLYTDRRVGVSYTRFDTDYYVSFGLFCGDELEYDDKVQPGMNGTARFVFRPINKEGRVLHLGTGLLVKSPNKVKETNSRPLTLYSRNVSYLTVPYMYEVSFEDVKNQCLLSFEAVTLMDRFFFQTEYMHSVIKQRQASTVNTYGAYCEGGFLIKGSKFGYDQPDAVPLAPPDPHSLLISARFNWMNLNGNNQDGGREYDVTLGLNYNLNSHIILKMNYAYIWNHRFSVEEKEKWGLLQGRVQVFF